VATLSALVSGLDTGPRRLGCKDSTLVWYQGCWRRMARYLAAPGQARITPTASRPAPAKTATPGAKEDRAGRFTKDVGAEEPAITSGTTANAARQRGTPIPGRRITVVASGATVLRRYSSNRTRLTAIPGVHATDGLIGLRRDPASPPSRASRGYIAEPPARRVA
jgi:hypothetical protein